MHKVQSDPARCITLGLNLVDTSECVGFFKVPRDTNVHIQHLDE